jgi:plastocyanin
MRSSSVRSFLALVAVAALSSACNSSSPTSNAPPPGGGNSPPAQSASVTATNSNTFSPNVVVIAAGGTVSFSNGGGLHNVATGAWSCAVGCDDQGGDGSPSGASWSFTRTFPTAGVVNYVCDEHAGVGMTGQIDVR